ncbi:hypothetical protein DB30_00146 [Enhygromyxa salina]|uniref:Uncharacterized protein n=1 Tax=Enhygromyxa salina TaxID=215803 RepID=A0A0C2DIY3_9BACT|nr:hypothetical protein DB30_00146 [Enhygromyxa salina]
MPPGLQPVPFPLEQQRRPDPAPGTGVPLPNQGPEHPPPRKRSIVDLRDPFDRPPPRAPARGQRQREGLRMLIPDLKDPFAQGARQVRSTTLERHVPNDIRDPFRARPASDNPRPPCTKTTDDGTVVQAPSNGEASNQSAAPACKQSDLDLHDPFTREASR